MKHVMNKRWEVACDQRASSLARELIINALGSRAPHALIDDAALLTSELVSNVLRHTGESCVLTLRFDHGDEFVEIGVTDSAPDLPVNLIERQPHTIGGFGLRMVDRLSNRWGCTRNSDSKTVWFQLGNHIAG